MLSRILAALLFATLLSTSTPVGALVTPNHASRDVAGHAALAARLAAKRDVLPLEARSSSGAKKIRKRCKPKVGPSTITDTPANQAAPPASKTTHATSTPAAKPPPPKTSNPPPPKTTHKPSPSPQPQPAPAPAPAPGGNPILTGVHTGDGTFYSTGLDACGDVDNDGDMIAAIGHQAFDDFPGSDGNSNQNPICGRSVTAHYQGKSVTVQIKDRCAGCDEFSLDFSPTAFQQLAPLSVGRITGVTWSFN